MDFLGRIPKLSNQAAGLVVFLVGYVTAAITAYNFFDTPKTIPWLIACIVLASLLFMSIVFGIAWSAKRTDVVDVAWGLVFIVIAVTSWLLSEYSPEIGWNIQTITFGLVAVWGLRLAITLLLRTVGRSEDNRYVELRKTWRGDLALNTYLRIFVVQALLAVVISVSVIVILVSPVKEPGIYAYIGAGVWAIGFVFEVLGDWQLKQFIMNPKNKGKLLTSGLWNYTRHPNYFGESMMWWGIFIIALSTYVGWIGIISPVIITFLLLFVSGVPMAEVASSRRKGWKQYAAHTSKFLPLPPQS